MCGALQRVLRALGHAVGGFLAQLAQHDGGRPAEVGERSELEIEQDRDRNGDGDREARRQPQAAVAHAAGRQPTARRLARLACPRCPGYPSVQAYSDLRDFGADPVDERPAARASAGCRVSSALRDLVGFEQQILALVGGRARRRSARDRAPRRPRRRRRAAPSRGGSPAAGSAAGSRRWPSS